MSTVNQQGNTGGGRPPSAVVNTNDPVYGGGGSFHGGQLVGDFGVTSFPPGTPVSATATPGVFLPGLATTLQTATCVGLLVEAADSGDTVQAQDSGDLTLTEAQWDAITAGSGGLATGSIYYLSAVSPTGSGKLSTGAPFAGGTFVTAVGVATSPTTLAINISAIPKAN